MSTSSNILEAAGADTAPGTLSEAATTDNDILIALNKLDAENDDHWTTTGKPAMEAVNALLPAAITRARLDEVAPNFSRPEASPDNVAVGGGGGGTIAGDEEPKQGVIRETLHFGQFSNAKPAADEPAQVSVEGRVSDLEADVAYLRKQFGWPTKDA